MGGARSTNGEIGNTYKILVVISRGKITPSLRYYDNRINVGEKVCEIMNCIQYLSVGSNSGFCELCTKHSSSIINENFVS
jgi:hypothetical protein